MLMQLFGMIDGLGSLAVAVVNGVAVGVEFLYSAGASNGLDGGTLAAGGAAGGAAGAGAANGAPSGTTGSGTEDGTAGGSNVGRNDRTRPRASTSVQARRDAQKVYDASAAGRLNQQLLKASETVQKWTESIIGVDEKGTTAAASLS